MKSIKTRLLAILLAALVLPAFLFVQNLSLPALEKLIAEKYPVAAISHSTLFNTIATDSVQNYLFFDVRSEKEYAVSHLENAIRIDPELPAEHFIRKYGERIAGKELVFYCSVGYRSSKFIERVDSLARQNGSLSLRNLTGGIFRWYNEKLPVFDENGETGAVHPYDAFWGTLLVKKREQTERK